MSQRYENGADHRASSSREDTGKIWTNPLEAGSSKLPTRPIDPSPSHSKRSYSPDRGERSSKRKSPGRDDNGRRTEGYSQPSKRRSRSPEERSGYRYSSKPEPGIYDSPPTKTRDLSGSSWVSDQGHHNGGRDRREERNDGGYHGSSSASSRSRHEPAPRRDDWELTSRYEDRHNLEHRRSRMEAWRPEKMDTMYERGHNGDRRDGPRDRDTDRSRDHHLDYSSRSSRSNHDDGSRKQRHRSRTRSPATRRPEAEEGEIDEWPNPLHEGLPASSEREVFRLNATVSTLPPPQPEEASHSGSPSVHRPIKIKQRPTNRGPHVNVQADTSLTSSTGLESGRNTARSHHSDRDAHPPPPPPAQNRTVTPPPPTAGLTVPPPPVDRPPTPPPDPSRITPKSTHTSKSNPLSPTFSASSSQPRNRTLEITKSQAKYDGHGDRADGKTSVPHAPNRNLLNPNTRPTTPAAKLGTPGGRDAPTTKVFLRPNAEDEMKNLHKSFFGTTTLAAYDLGDKLGEGTFGVVTKGIEIATKRAIALKKLITHNPRDGVSVTTVREIKILKSLTHPSIVEIIDMVVERKNHADRTQRGEVFMVFPYMDHDMCGLLSNSDFKLSHSVAKLLMRQILEGMDYIHTNNFIHRDIKTANILVDREGGIKIADFGLARAWTFDEMMPRHLATEYTNMVVTRWYRAPELLLGDRHYGPAVDMWSIGCVLGEMYHRIPILQGETDRDQLFKIFGKLGRPSDESFPGWNKLPGFPDSIGYPWDKVSEDQPLLHTARKWGMDRGGADLMIKLLRLDPVRRLSAAQALEHDWFRISPKPANKAPNLIAVESSHEMTQRIKNDPPAMIRPKQQRPPPQHRPPQQQQAWNVPPPQHQQRHPMNGNANGANPYAGGGGGGAMMPNNRNPYGQQRPGPPFNAPPIANYGNGPPNPAYGNGHGPPGMPMGGGMGGNGSYGGQYQGGGGAGRAPHGHFQGGPGQGMGGIPSRPPLAGHGYSARPNNFNSPGPGGPVRRVAPPNGFLLGGGSGGGGNLPNLPKRPPTVMDASKRRDDTLPYM